MHLVCPNRLIHLIGLISLHFEKKLGLWLRGWDDLRWGMSTMDSSGRSKISQSANSRGGVPTYYLVKCLSKTACKWKKLDRGCVGGYLVYCTWEASRLRHSSQVSSSRLARSRGMGHDSGRFSPERWPGWRQNIRVSSPGATKFWKWKKMLTTILD